MANKKIQRGEPLQSALLELERDDTLEIPYKMYSANTIRATASQLKYDKGVAFEVNAKGEKFALVTRVS